MNYLLSKELTSEIESFLLVNNLVDFFKKYEWGLDSWNAGFPQILDLEMKLSISCKIGEFRRDNILSVAKWGKLRNLNRVTCPEVFTISNIHSTDSIVLLEILKKNIKGMGPTYLSKVLRFSSPELFGAIDTRLVRIFGDGDEQAKKHSWLKIKVRNNGYGWYIPEYQSAWPAQYDTWVNILQYIANSLNNKGNACPHPKTFLENKLRKPGKWTSADVEMALFSYASQKLGK